MVEIESQDVSLRNLESWIEAARRGDRDALGQALVSFRQYPLLVANQGLDPSLAVKDGASDIVQDALFRAQRSFGDFRGRSEAEWRSWLKTILVRRLAYHRRRYVLTSKRRQAIEVPITAGMRGAPASRDPTPSAEYARREREVALLAAVDRLPDHYRQVVLEHHRDRLTFDEIGRRRGISAEAARKLWTRSLVRLRQELGPQYESA